MGVRNLTISNNIVYNWRSPMYFNRNCFAVRVINNKVQDPFPFGGKPLNQIYTFNTAEVDFAGNSYYSSSDPSRWYRVNASNVSTTQWQATMEGDMTMENIVFLDPSRSTASYVSSIGLGSTHANLMAEMRKQSRSNWRPNLTVDALLGYFRAGFIEVNP